jgi:alpha-tubulin suppressor-like RCC1 family protein
LACYEFRLRNLPFTKSPLKSLLAKALALLIAYCAQSALCQGQVSTGTVIAWGANDSGQSDVPLNLTNATSVSAGESFDLALNADGTVTGWGDDSLGQITFPANLTNVVSLAATYWNGMAVVTGQTLVAWGLEAAPSGANAIAVGGGAPELWVQSDGTVIGWGFNGQGQTSIPPGLTNVVAVTAGEYHSMALTSYGTVVAWGGNFSGQTNVPSGLSNVVAISAGYSFSMALQSNGTVVVWGDNTSGETNIPAGLNNVVAISAGENHCLALKNDGTVVAWGDDSAGQTDIPSGLTNVIGISAGGAHSMAVVKTGGPLFIGQQPFSQSIYPGDPCTFKVLAVGTPPYSYQWLFSGTNIGGATNALLTLPNVQPTNSGNYSVIVSDANGSVTSSNAMLTVVIVPPIITSQTPNSLVLLGSNMTISVSATGPAPMTYQWLFNATIIPGATNASLTLTNFQDVNEGDYTVIVSNAYYGTNADIFLTAGDLGSALNAPYLTWTGDWAWETNLTHDGIAAARSADNGALHTSDLVTTVNGPGTLSFWWWISSNPQDTLTFYVNGVSQAAISFTIGSSWTQFSMYLPGGTQTLDWRYKRNSSIPVAQTAAFLDQVSYVAGPTLILTTSPTNQSVPATGNVTFNVSAIGTQPISYQWQFNGTNIPNATNTSLGLSGLQAPNAGNYSAVVSNPYLTNVATATLTVIPVPPSVTSQPANQRTPLNGVAGFSVGVTGSTPFSYQWQFNGTNIDSATNSSLTITNVQATNAGAYQATISNGAGVTNSHTAILTVAQLIGWGSGSPVPVTIPLTLTNAAAIAAGESHGLALNFDSTITAWGDNSYRQTNVPAALSNVAAISAGFYHSLALKNDGTVVAWGAGTNNLFLPNAGQSIVPPGLTNVLGIAAGAYHSLIVKSNGTVLAWGYNSNGQTNVPAGLSNIVAVAAGAYHNLALRNDGTVVAWGAGTNISSPPNFGQSKVPAGLSNVVAIAAGVYHSLALKSDGTIIAWGNNAYGQTNVPAGFSNVVAISCGGYHNFAISVQGALTVWGNNQYGQTNIPVGVTNVVAAAGGLYYSMCVMNNGTPVIVRESASQSIYAGANDTLSVAPIGAGPLSFQWLFDGTNIVGATNSILNLVQLPLTGSGSYQCVVSNALGSVTSAPVTLSVLRTIPQFLVSSSSLQLTSTGLNLTLGNLSGHGPAIVYASTNLSDWQPILTNPATVGSLQIVDPSATNSPVQFYRAVEQ